MLALACGAVVIGKVFYLNLKERVIFSFHGDMGEETRVGVQWRVHVESLPQSWCHLVHHLVSG